MEFGTGSSGCEPRGYDIGHIAHWKYVEIIPAFQVVPTRIPDLTDILDQRDRDYCIAWLRSRWVRGIDVCGAGGR